MISHLGAAVKIHDPGHQIANAWNKTTGVGRVHKPSACFYDLREGCYRGVIDSATTGTWLGQQVTFVTVNAGAFESWMVSWGGSGPDVFVQLGGQSAKVIGADQPADGAFPNGGFKRLILQGQGYTGAAAGQWYTIQGNCTTEDIARCGSWSAPASHSGGATTFALSPFAEVRDEQIGWWLQPNINCQALFPIIAVSESAHTVTVAGNHAALGAQGTRFRIHAPPGVQTRGPRAGLLPMFAEAASSRCLYKGYRYEAPASGRWDDVAKAVAARQGGSNFTGQHYTLFRHFDPSLMRFTSLDPIAASQNLWAYCDNNPHGAYDPDGLNPEKKWTAQSWFGDIWREGWGWVDRSVGGNGWIAGMGQISGGTADMVYLAVTLPAQPIIWAASGEAPMPVQNWVNTVNNAGARWDYLSRADEGTGTKLAAVSIGVATDLSGLTGLGEAYSGHSLTTGDALTQEERNMRWVTGGFAITSYAMPVFGKGLGLARSAGRSISTALSESGAGRPRMLLPRANRGAVLNPWRALSKDLAIQEALEGGHLREIKMHANRLDSQGPRTVYAVRESGTGRVLHIGETGDLASRAARHRVEFGRRGIKIDVDPRRLVEGKQAAINLQERYIRTYERVFGQKPQYNKSYR